MVYNIFMCIHEFHEKKTGDGLTKVCVNCEMTFEDALLQTLDHLGMTREELGRIKVLNTDWSDPDKDEDKFWRQCTAVAEIDPNWLENWLKTPSAPKILATANGRPVTDFRISYGPI